ncbi:ABC transporter permease [Clostridium sp.]|uniref:ABC transporter permease n=1 Tax=Clostridium sp. TaxID=1506 RepID=UPI002FCACE3D
MEKKIALQYIKSRKKKNIIIIATIALVTAFLTAICIYGLSFNKMIENSIKSLEGNYDASLYVNLKNDFESIDKYSNVKELGEVVSVHSEETKEAYINYEYLNKTALDMYLLEVIKGEYPIGEMDIAVDKIYLDKNNKNIGDKINLFNKEFKIVGVIDNVQYDPTKESLHVPNYGIYLSKSYAEKNSKENMALIKLNNLSDYENELNKIANLIGKNKEDVYLNESIIQLSTKDISSIVPYLLLVLLITISAFFIIYNIFYIILGERIKALGLLLTIGITSKQLRKMVVYESMILSAIAIPIGLVLGVVSSFAVIKFVYINGDLRFYINPIVIPLVIILTLFTVFLSVILPARKVSKLSPIEATKYSEQSSFKIKKKGRKTSNDVFKDLAKVNLWRNKKATSITIISIVLSIILFIVAATMLKSMNVEVLVKSRFISDIEVDVSFMELLEDNLISNDVVEEIKEIKGIKSIEGLKAINVSEENNFIKLVGVNDQLVKKIKNNIVLGEFNESNFKNGTEGISCLIHGESSYKIGDIVKVKGEDGVERDIKITAIVGEQIIELYSEPIYVYNKSNIFNGVNDNIKVLIDTNKGMMKSVSNSISSITSNYKNIDEPRNFDQTLEDLKEEKKGIQFVGYLIVFVIAFIGMMNFANTMISSIISRKRELGMLRAVGLTDREVKKVVINEGMYLVGITSIIGIISGNIIAAIATILFKQLAGYISYSFPLIENIFCIIAMVLVLFVVTRASLKKITKDSVVDQIRFED